MLWSQPVYFGSCNFVLSLDINLAKLKAQPLPVTHLCIEFVNIGVIQMGFPHYCPSAGRTNQLKRFEHMSL